MRVATVMLPLALSALSLQPSTAQAALYISIIQGLGGEAEYQSQFDEQREQILSASTTMTDRDKVRAFHGAEATREHILAHFHTLGTSMGDEDRALIYLIGHGSFDGFEYKFNIPGPDLSASDFKTLLDDLPGRDHALVNTSSTSGALLEALTEAAGGAAGDEEAVNPRYILVTATRNGNERNATHFGRFFAEALTSDAADLNKNSSISIQEAFDFADRSVSTYFEDAGRLATEHPQLRGDGAARFSLARLGERQPDTEDPRLNDLQQQRRALDAEIEELQLRRNEMSNADYLERLQALVLESAQLSERIEAAQRGPADGTE